MPRIGRSAGHGIEMGSADVHTPQMRHAGRDLLSLALLDARNVTLRWLAAFEESAAAVGGAAPAAPDVQPPMWRIGHVAWFQERWIARNVHRQRGDAADPTAPRLASLLAQSDRWFDPAQSRPAARGSLDLPDAQALRAYLAETMDLTLELLDGADESDAGLYAFRLALLHEDLQAERLAEAAQALGVSLPAGERLVDDVTATPPRPALLFPASRWRLGSPPGGFVFDVEKWAHEVAVPEFEIDAQPVTWAQYAEFVDDGGYDEPHWWSPEGFAWAQAEARRGPRDVDQLRGGVLQRRFGRLARVPSSQPVLHVSWHEAQAWCRWAGRRLPAEVEWEAAAQSYSRGFAWGGVREWTASTLRPYPGFEPDAWRGAAEVPFGRAKAVRGASFATRPRMRHVKSRGWAPAAGDRAFVGFRSCAA